MPRAPKICSAQGCSTLVRDGGSKCVERHRVAWANKSFDKRRADTSARRLLRRDVFKAAKGVCEIRFPGCTFIATQLDRIDNTKDYERRNCQAACAPCHGKKTSQEGHEAQGHNVSSRYIDGMGY